MLIMNVFIRYREINTIYIFEDKSFQELVFSKCQLWCYLIIENPTMLLDQMF